MTPEEVQEAQELAKLKTELFKATERVHEFKREVELRDGYLLTADQRLLELQRELSLAQASAQVWQEKAMARSGLVERQLMDRINVSGTFLDRHPVLFVLVLWAGTAALSLVAAWGLARGTP